MSIVSDSYTLCSAERGLLRIDYQSVRETAAGRLEKQALLWFDRRNIPWLAEAVRRRIDIYAQPESARDAHGDHLKVYESGPEQEPYINLENERDADAQHAGYGWFAMSKQLAVTLVTELRAFGAVSDGGP